MNFTDSSLATSISDLFLKAIVLNERKQQRDEKLILARIKEQPKAMQIARGRASGLLSTYHTTARHHAPDLLHALFSTRLEDSVTRSTRSRFQALRTMPFSSVDVLNAPSRVTEPPDWRDAMRRFSLDERVKL